ncbi:MAG: pyridoxal-phosphate dependent enzyme, partial [Verrucomicrobiota bacterium]|nr:pyridoxal-phosphate dependent enzyme [Verrucomicrobiota bacterium]
MIHETLRPALRPTMITHAATISAEVGAEVVLISEVEQHTGSFKFRAAYNVAASVPNEMLIAASSGNFGQALACACQLLKKRAIIVMPHTSAKVKIAGVQGYGATVDIIDVNEVGRAQRVAQLAKEYPNARVCSAYDDPLVIAGNSTLGEEIATADLGLDAVVVPIGGGGLSSGVITGLRRCGDPTPVFGAEPLLGNDAARSLRQNKLVCNDHEPLTIADGARTISLGRHNWEVIRDAIADIVEVPDSAIEQGVRL